MVGCFRPWCVWVNASKYKVHGHFRGGISEIDALLMSLFVISAGFAKYIDVTRLDKQLNTTSDIFRRSLHSDSSGMPWNVMG